MLHPHVRILSTEGSHGSDAYFDASNKLWEFTLVRPFAPRRFGLIHLTHLISFRPLFKRLTTGGKTIPTRLLSLIVALPRRGALDVGSTELIHRY